MTQCARGFLLAVLWVSKRLLYASEALGSDATLNPDERTLSNALSLSTADATPFTRRAGRFDVGSLLVLAVGWRRNAKVMIYSTLVMDWSVGLNWMDYRQYRERKRQKWRRER